MAAAPFGANRLFESAPGVISARRRARSMGIQRALHGSDDTRMAIADLMHAVAVKIENPPPLVVDQRRALGGDDLVEAGRRERLMQEPALVFIEGCARSLAERGAPGGTVRRKVHVAFAGFGGVGHSDSCFRRLKKP